MFVPFESWATRVCLHTSVAHLVSRLFLRLVSPAPPSSMVAVFAVAVAVAVAVAATCESLLSCTRSDSMVDRTSQLA